MHFEFVLSTIEWIVSKRLKLNASHLDLNRLAEVFARARRVYGVPDFIPSMTKLCGGMLISLQIMH